MHALHFALIGLFLVLCFPESKEVRAQEVLIESQGTVSSGWHPWYEMKIDPEDANNLIICGSRWDGESNALFGFVYASSDAGKTWRVALEDKNSTWVSEQSCAFGPAHTAYFISEASEVTDGDANHRRGIARLFVSSTGGQRWIETLRMGWADWSTSAVSSKSGDLMTFFHDSGTAEKERNLGSSVGLLVFSPDGKNVTGPFLSSRMKALNYQGVYPSNAVSLDDGTVVALYYGRRATPAGREYDLGIVRASQSSPDSPTFVRIASSTSNSNRQCFSALGDYSLAYDKKGAKLLAVYLDENEGTCGLTIAASEDGGQTWTKHFSSPGSCAGGGRIFRPSVAVNSGGQAAILGFNTAGRWLFWTFNDSMLLGPPTEIWTSRARLQVSNDSLWTVVKGPHSARGEGRQASPLIDISVRSYPSRIWRSSGLLASGLQFHAAALAADGTRQNLYSAVVAPPVSGEAGHDSTREKTLFRDVTAQVMFVYGGKQTFDNATGMLSIDLRLVNRGETPISIPVRLVVESVDSASGQVTIVNADNGLTGRGAIWDISRFITGGQVPSGAAMFGSFRLQFHVDLAKRIVSTGGFLSLSARVLSGGKASCLSSPK